MSARQPFLPSRPASRTVNPGEETGATSNNFANVISNNNTSNTEGSIRALNLSGLKKSKSAQRTTDFSNAATAAAGDPASDATAAAAAAAVRNNNQHHHQNQQNRARSAAVKSSTTMRIYAPHPFTPPPPGGASAQFPPAPEFKTPSLPFAKNIEDAVDTAGPLGSSGSGCPVETIGVRHGPDFAAQVAPAPAPASGLFRPMSCRPQDEMSGGAQARRHQSFFGSSAQFSFDAANLDDSGYYSSVSEQQPNNDDEENRNEAARSVNVNVRANSDFDAAFANPMNLKRVRPDSPDGREVVVLGSRSREMVSKRPRGGLSPQPSRHHHHRHHGPLAQDSTALRNSPPGGGGMQTRALPPNVPPPMATIGDLPGLEFSEADLARYAELYEKGCERWSGSTMEEWLGGAKDIMAKFTEMLDMIKEHMSSKVNLYRSLHTKLADEHTSHEQRAKELRDASQAVVRDSGSIGGGLDANHHLDARTACWS